MLGVMIHHMLGVMIHHMLGVMDLGTQVPRYPAYIYICWALWTWVPGYPTYIYVGHKKAGLSRLVGGSDPGSLPVGTGAADPGASGGGSRYLDPWIYST